LFSWNDERIRNVQCTGDELFAAAAGDGAGRHAAKVFWQGERPDSGAWVAIIFCAICWALCLGLGFKRLVTLDIMLYGASLMLNL